MVRITFVLKIIQLDGFDAYSVITLCNTLGGKGDLDLNGGSIEVGEMELILEDSNGSDQMGYLPP